MSYRAFSDRFLQATRVGDAAALADMLAPDFEVVEAQSLPYAGTYRGLDGWLALGRAVIAAWSGFRIEVLGYAGESDDALILRMGIAGRSRVTGTLFATQVLEYWRFRDGRLWRIEPFYFDTHLLVTANGG